MTFVPITEMNINIEGPRRTIGEKEKVVESLRSDDIHTEAFEFRYDNEARDLEELAISIEQLSAFRDTVKRYGLTRSLISFADYDKKLSGAIAAVPALEALGSDRSVKSSSDVVVALEASIADAIEIFLRKMKARVKNLIIRITAKAERLGATALHIKTLKTMMESGRVLNEKLATTRQFKLMSRNDLFSSIKTCGDVEAFITKIARTKFPTNEVSYKEWLDEVRREFDPIGREINIKILDHGGWDILEEDLTSSPWSKNTLRGYGYTKIEDFLLIVEAFEKAEKIIPQYISAVNVMYNYLRQSSVNHESEKYIRHAVASYCSLVSILTDQTSYILCTAAIDVLKAIFSCTEKK